MNIEKLIERLEAWNEQHLSVVCGNGHFACDYLCESEDCIVVQAATALSTLQAENEKLRAERDMWKAGMEDCQKSILELESELNDLKAQWDMYGGDEGITSTFAELEQVKRERDAAIEYLREIEWCAGCKNFGGLDGCKKWVIGQCTEKYDLYEFIGPQKED